MVTEFLDVTWGGVCAYVCNGFIAQIVSPLKITDSNVEIVRISCCYERNNHFIACCYHPPKPSDPVFVDDLTKAFEAIISTVKDDIIIIAGDLNKSDMKS